MKTDKKDKLIIFLIIGIILIFAKNFNDRNDNLYIEKKNNDLENSYENGEITEKEVNTVKKVHISGEINKAGVYEIEDNDRLEDLVNKAGGLTSEANLDAINLSMRLEDQMRVIIPNIKEIENNIDPKTVSESTSNEKININTATKEELMSLPNIGESRAKSIIDYRELNRFENIEDIKKVSGIGDKYFEQMKELIKTN